MSGDINVANWYDNCIRVFDQGGHEKRTIGCGDGQFNGPFGIAHLTSEGHLEEIGYGCTGHHQLYGVNSWYGELLHVSDQCSWVDELCVPMDASFRALFNQWRAVYGDVHSFIHPYVVTNGDRDLT